MTDPIEPKYKDYMHGLATAINQILNPDQATPTVGFILFMFELSDLGRFNYLSNANREDATLSLLEYIKHVKGEGYPDSFNHFKAIAMTVLKETLEGDPLIPFEVAATAQDVFEVKLDAYLRKQ